MPKRIEVDNWRALVGAILGFLGTLFITIDRFSVSREWMNSFGAWQRIAAAQRQLHQLAYVSANQTNQMKYAQLGPEEPGFADLETILRRNLPILSGKRLLRIVNVEVVGFGEQKLRVINVVTADAPTKAFDVCVEFQLATWISVYRSDFFLGWGFSIVTLGAAFSIWSRFRRPARIAELKNPDRPPISENIPSENT